ncbi:hypothetical protein V1264_022267 [Littorina saxatilis]|uniref:DUF7043 domain-containing protein n=1 Tax=Littorina saxatilis TaxID=31220 RepID=A0AAN9FXG0_9CAEN
MMKERSFVTQATFVTLLVTSSPLLLLVLHSSHLHVRASNLPLEPQCSFPEFLQTKKNKQWMMKQSNTLTTFDVDGGKLFARYGTCVRPRNHQRRRQSGVAECVKSNYTRVCLEKRADNKYLVRHVESDFDDKFVCLEFLKRGVSVVQVKMSLIQGKGSVSHLCDDRYMHVDPWPWISEEHYRSDPVPCPFSGGYNLLLKYSSPPPAGRYRYYGTSSYSSPSSYTSHLAEGGPQDCMDSSTAPIRMESDCVDREGVVFNFKHESCLPAGTHLSLHQRALCMATWQDGRELFAMLRADNNDRAFFCLRVALPNPEEEYSEYYGMSGSDQADDLTKIEEVVLFIGWVCPTSSYADATRRYSGSHSASAPQLTPHMAFTVRDQQVITEPCSDELSTCHNHTSFCRHLQCMKTCGKCLAAENSDSDSSPTSFGTMAKKATVVTSDRFSVRYAKSDGKSGLVLAGEANGEAGDGETLEPHNNDNLHHHHHHHSKGVESTEQKSHQRKCTFPDNVRGTWLQRDSDGNDSKLVITESSFNHPTLGRFECVTFTPPGSPATPLRRVLWSRYGNGCYPRFTCLHYNTPAKSVMRYRLANVQHWPLLLTDDSICDDRHFMEPPDMYQPGDTYAIRSWEVVRRSGHIHKIACILPHYLSKVVSFKDDRGRSGCLVHGTYYSPRAISLTFFPQSSGATARTGEATTPHRTQTGVHTALDVSGVDRDRDVSEVGHDADRDVNAVGRDVGRDVNAVGRDVGRDVSEAGRDVSSGRAAWQQRGAPHSHVWENHRPDEQEPGYKSGYQEKYPWESAQSVDYHSDSGRASHRDNDPPVPRHGADQHKAWRDKIGGVREHEISHQFPPGMNEHDLNQTYIYINGESGQKPDDDLQSKSYEDYVDQHNTNSNNDYYKNYPYAVGGNAHDNNRHRRPHNRHRDTFPKQSNNFITHQAKKERYKRSSTDRENYMPRSVERKSYKRSRTERYIDKPNRTDREMHKASQTKRDRFKRSSSRERETHYISKTKRDRYKRSRGGDVRSRVQLSYECLAVMTYVDSYKSLLTVTSDDPNEILCWLVVGEQTVVILKTSSCNSQTAQRVLANPARGGEHVHKILHLHQGERDCDAMFPADPVRPEPIEFRDEDDHRSGARGCVLFTLKDRVRLLAAQVILIVVVGMLLIR